MSQTLRERAQEIVDSYEPSRRHLLSLYRRPTVFTLVKERNPDLGADDLAATTDILWDLLHP